MPTYLGGAERLVVDAAMALQKLGHTVDMYTSYHDPKHCFEETRDGTLNVLVYGNWLPRHIKGRLSILFATLRNLYAAGCIAWNWGDSQGGIQPENAQVELNNHVSSGNDEKGGRISRKGRIDDDKENPNNELKVRATSVTRRVMMKPISTQSTNTQGSPSNSGNHHDGGKEVDVGDNSGSGDTKNGCERWRMLRRSLSGKYDVFVVDQISTAIPLLHLTDAAVFFYCHFPDLLLSNRTSLLKRLYRIPFDWVEEQTVGKSII